jgi:hypothetical protein
VETEPREQEESEETRLTVGLSRGTDGTTWPRYFVNYIIALIKPAPFRFRVALFGFTDAVPYV